MLLLVLLLAGLGAVWSLTAMPASGQSEGRLRNSISSGKARERTLASAAARLARLERASAREVAILDARLADVQGRLNGAEARLTQTQAALAAERDRALRLRRRLAQSRALLTELLRQRYMGDRPDLVTVVLDSHGFADLLERMEFLHRVQENDTAIVRVVRSARFDAKREARVLARLEARRRAIAQDVRRRRDAVAGIAAAAQQRRQEATCPHDDRASEPNVAEAQRLF